jgi:hypothetical protein
VVGEFNFKEEHKKIYSCVNSPEHPKRKQTLRNTDLITAGTLHGLEIELKPTVIFL